MPFLFVLLFLSSTSCSLSAMSTRVGAVENKKKTNPKVHGFSSKIDTLASLIGKDGEIDQNFWRVAISLNLELPSTDRDSLGRAWLMESDGSNGRKIVNQLAKLKNFLNPVDVQINHLTGIPVIVQHMLTGQMPKVAHFAKAYEECFGLPIDWNVKLQKPSVSVPKKVQDSLGHFYEKTLLQIGLSQGDHKEVEYLLRIGGQHLRMDVTDERGLTPLQMAIFRGWADIAEKMINLGADVNGSSLCSESPLVSAVIRDNEAVVDSLLSKNPGLKGAVVAAIRRAQPSMLSKLLTHIQKSGESVDLNYDGRNVLQLMTMLRGERYWQHFNDVRPQLNVNELLMDVTADGNNVLHLGVLFGRKRAFWNSFTKEELAPGIEIQNIFKETPLHMAAMNNPDAVEQFNACGLLTAENVKVTDIHGETPIGYALKSGNPELIKQFGSFLSKNQKRKWQNRQKPDEVNQSVADGRTNTSVISGNQKPRKRMEKLDSEQLGFDKTRIVHESSKVIVLRHGKYLYAFPNTEPNKERVLPPLPQIKRYKDDQFHDIEGLQPFVEKYGGVVGEDYFKCFGGTWDPEKHMVIGLRMAKRPCSFNVLNFECLTPEEFNDCGAEFGFEQNESGSYTGFHGMIKPNKNSFQLKAHGNYLEQ